VARDLVPIAALVKLLWAARWGFFREPRAEPRGDAAPPVHRFPAGWQRQCRASRGLDRSYAEV